MFTYFQNCIEIKRIISEKGKVSNKYTLCFKDLIVEIWKTSLNSQSKKYLEKKMVEYLVKG